MNRIIVFLSFFLLLFLQSCVEKDGYYDYGQEKTISLLTRSKWERKYHAKLDNGTEMDIHDIYIFYKDGRGTYQTKTVYMDGKIDDNTSYFHWSFTTPNFQIIYMDYPLFWEIRQLTETKLSIIETYRDPITEPGQHYREYYEYVSVKKDGV